MPWAGPSTDRFPSMYVGGSGICILIEQRGGFWHPLMGFLVAEAFCATPTPQDSVERSWSPLVEFLACWRCLCPSTNMFIIFFTGEPPFLPESFDRVLLDAPCSGMGQRPNMACTWTLKEVMSYQPLQRKLFTVVCDATLLWKKGDLVWYFKDLEQFS